MRFFFTAFFEVRIPAFGDGPETFAKGKAPQEDPNALRIADTISFLSAFQGVAIFPTPVSYQLVIP